ncbi:MAG TPA: ABC transporter ATP-binding protein [Chloroflexota bacterium]|nr:ABC transporter ATP-binding protein [Chloroflexota bacterium]
MRDTWRALQVMVEISLRADMLRSLGAVVTAAANMVAPPFRAIGYKLITDSILVNDPRSAMWGVALVVGLTATSRLMFWWSFNIRVKLRENTQVYLDAHIMELTAGIPGIEHHERPEYLDNVERVRAERWALANPFNPLSWTFASVLQVVGICALLVSVHPLLLLLPLAAVPSIIATLRSQRAATRLRESQAEPNRVLRHLQDLTTEAGPAKEIRIFGLSGLLLERRRALFSDLERARMRQSLWLTAATTLAWAFFAACFAALIAFTVDLATRGIVSVGAVMLVLGLGAQINFQLAILVANVNWLIRTHSAVRKLVWLRDYARSAGARLAPRQPLRVPQRLHDGIRFDAVSFTYPGTERPVLETLDLFLPAGSTVAIVGENGAGKTTLVKLLSRFYEPTSGTILVDGIDLRRMPIAEWRGRLAAGFQDFTRLQLLARESIGVGDTTRLADDPSVHAAMARAAAGDLLTTLPQGLDTQLGRSFEGGVDLSLGQWQKIALSRAMMREQVLLLLLDEPTASLDAPTEHALFEHFAAAARDYAASSGAITLLVSHRFSTVRRADLILVAANGKIVERGSHTDLIRQRGLYAELYNLQASAYR